MILGCAHGKVAQCRVIEALADDRGARDRAAGRAAGGRQGADRQPRG